MFPASCTWCAKTRLFIDRKVVVHVYKNIETVQKSTRTSIALGIDRLIAANNIEDTRSYNNVHRSLATVADSIVKPIQQRRVTEISHKSTILS